MINIRDKIIVLLGTGLLGYYLALKITNSISSIIWNRLLLALPPLVNPPIAVIKPPQFYIGFIGFVLGVIIAYILFTLFVEKRKVKSHIKQYLVAITLLFVAPLLIAGVFRIHTVIDKSGIATPAGITMIWDDNIPGNSITFQEGSSSAPEVKVLKHISAKPKGSYFEPKGSYFDEICKLIRDQDIEEATTIDDHIVDTLPNLVMLYLGDKRNYGREIYYDDGVFKERALNKRWVQYQSNDLEKVLDELTALSRDLQNYSSANIITSSTDSVRGAREIDGADFDRLVNSINNANKISPDSQETSRIKHVLQQNKVAEDENNIIAFYLVQKKDYLFALNFMVYDKATQIVMFDGNYYQADLSELLE